MNIERFMKKNKAQRENVKYAATKSLTDENGAPLEWTLRPVSSKETELIRDECVDSVPANKKTQFSFRTSKYIAKLICASVVEPNLNSKELQDSYGVMSAEDLLMEMVDNAREYQQFAEFVQNFNGLSGENNN